MLCTARVRVLRVCLVCARVPMCYAGLRFANHMTASLDRGDASRSCSDVDADLPMLMQTLQGNVVKHALDSDGCRTVQRALQLADDADRMKLVQEFRGHVCKATESPHGNFVLQRLVELMRPADVSFVLDELISCAAAPALARHRYGCRVVERIIEHFPPRMLASHVDDMLCDVQALCKHIYGNFVIQHLLEHGEQKHRKRIIQASNRDLKTVALDQYGGNVVDKALRFAPVEVQRRLADLVLRERGLLGGMALLRSGFAATQRLIRVVREDGQMLEKVRSELAAADMHRRHGRRFFAAAVTDAPPSLGAQVLGGIQEMGKAGTGGLGYGRRAPEI